MTKYQKYYLLMWDEHKELFGSFSQIHDAYKQDQKDKRAKSSFDSVGKEVRTIIEEWDQRLCAQMEKGSNGVFSSKVSDKFWSEVKKDFPFIDLVGVDVSFA